MAIKKATRFLLLLLILIFSLQLLSLTLILNIEGADVHAQNSGNAISASDYHKDSAIFNHISRKPFLKLSATKQQYFFETQVCSLKGIIKCLNQKAIIIDSRKGIVNNISNYFHGSKYKIVTSKTNI